MQQSVGTPGSAYPHGETAGTRPTSIHEKVLARRITTPAAQVLLYYRIRLATLLASAEDASLLEAPVFRLTIAKVVEDLTEDLIRLYEDLQRHGLTETDRTDVVPALERLRTVLRQRHTYSRRFRNTIRKMISAGPL